MKKLILPLVAVFCCCSLSGCGLMEDAFKAGVVITLIIAAIVGLLIWILHFSRKLLGKYFPEFAAMFDGFWDE